MPTRYTRRIRLLVACLFATLSGAALSAADAAAPGEPEAPPVELTFQNSREQGIRLAIPRAYLRNSKDWDTTFAMLWDIRFPDMQPPLPRRSYRQVVKALKEKGQPATTENVVREWELDKPVYDARVPLQYSVSVWISSGIPEGTGGMIDGIILRDPEYDDPLEPAFRHYRDAQNDGTVLSEYLIPRDEFITRSVWLKCFPRDMDRPGDLCSVHTMLGDRLSLQYGIPRKDVALWREVDTAVKAFVRRHVVDCFDGIRLKPSRQPLPTYACQFHARGSLPVGAPSEGIKKIDVMDIGRHVGYFDDAWPELEPAILEFIAQASTTLKETHAHVSAVKRKGHTFVAYARLTTDSKSGSSAPIVAVMTSCTLSIRLSQNPLLRKDPVRVICQSSLSSRSASGAIHELPGGPSLEYDPDETIDQSQRIREWSTKSAAFIREGTATIIESLRAE